MYSSPHLKALRSRAAQLCAGKFPPRNVQRIRPKSQGDAVVNRRKRRFDEEVEKYPIKLEC